jgi:hypothetical protein
LGQRLCLSYNKQTGKKIWQIAPSIGEDGKLIGYGYPGIGIEIMQDDGELIGTSKLIPLEDYKKIEAPFESEFDKMGQFARFFCPFVCCSSRCFYYCRVL